MKENKDNDSFRDLKFFEKIVVTVSLTLLVVLSIAFVIGIFYFGMAGLFQLFGVQYTSAYSLLGFVLVFFFVGFIVDLFSIAFIKLTSQYISNKYTLFITRMAIDSTFTLLTLHVVDEFMNSITISLLTEIVAAILLFFIDVAFDNKKEKASR